METLRALYESLGFLDVKTYVQSGNVVFRTKKRDLKSIGQQLEEAIEKDFGFRSAVILRTSTELRDVVVRNPFAARTEIEPGKLVVSFLASDPGDEARETVAAMKTAPEELRISGREMYTYFPDGMGKSKLSLPAIDRTLKTSSTARNWNSVTKLLAMAEELE